jgi:hypothetical protein
MTCGRSKHTAADRDAPGHAAIHNRLRRNRGLASAHLCRDCGNVAGTWALLHERATRYTLVPGRGWRPVSDDLDDYIPLCRSCHNTYDGVILNIGRKVMA